MGQALYRKYRSKKLSEIIGQEHVTETLDRALQSGRISHAYLFTGPRGVGKTSIARILAHEINGIPYEDDSLHMDIIEIDAASNRRIDEIRDLRDRVASAPTSAKYKVYIIDEVHMLTKEAFNALLKTLEEPPAHVIFILATTDAHKLPDTIVSRTQRFTFKPVEATKVVAHLRSIAETEQLLVDDDALALLAAHGEGSFRDSISLLDQASNRDERLTLSAVQLLLGIPPEQAIDELLVAMPAGGPAAAAALNGLYEQGFQAAAVAKSLGARLRRDLLAGTTAIGSTATLDLLGRLLEVPTAHDPERFLEIVILSASTDTIAPTVQPVASPTPAKQTPTKPAPSKVTKLSETVKPPTTPPPTKPAIIQPAKTPSPAQAIPGPTPERLLDANLWPQILGALKSKYNTLYGVVRMATPTFEDHTLELAFGFAFHQKRLSEPKNRKIMTDIVEELTGEQVRLEVCVRKDKPAAVPANVTTASPVPVNDLSAISDIFGGGEIIQ